jgi:hypothetical protein|tara:strand:- start:1265 stop:1765 length:501 start_codon:yes stop_codon:yes gene_type:complete
MNPYFDPTYSSAPPSWSLPEGSAPTWKPDPGTTFSWADQDEKDSPFDIFKNTLAEGIGSYSKRFAGAGEKTEGDNYIKSGGATTADLGGGNTLYVPDNTAAQLRMAQAGQQGSSGGGIGRMAGSILGQAGGAALGGTAALAGTALGSALGPLGAIAGGALGGLLPF